MKRNRKKIPVFKNEDQERDFWSKNSPLDFMAVDSARHGAYPNLKPTLKSIYMRLPEDMLEELKILAHKKDIHYQSLAKLYLAREILMERRAIESS